MFGLAGGDPDGHLRRCTIAFPSCRSGAQRAAGAHAAADGHTGSDADAAASSDGWG
jgi:hypothetical protein